MSELDDKDYDEDDDPVMAENHLVLKFFSDQIFTPAIARNGQFIKEKLELILIRTSVRGSQTMAYVRAEEELARDLREGLIVLPRMNNLSHLKCDVDKLFKLHQYPN